MPNNPFKNLPVDEIGEAKPIKAGHVQKIYDSLKIIYDTYSLTGEVFGQSFGEAKRTIAAKDYRIQKIMTVFGKEIDNQEEESMDDRKVIQVLPTELGEQDVAVILTEVVKTQRLMPNLEGLTYEEASERLRETLSDVTLPSSPVRAPELVDLSLSKAKQKLLEK